MAEQQIIETLARKVMGWHREIHPEDEKDQYGDFFWCDESGEKMAPVYKWNPLHNIADAMQLAEKAFGEEWFLHRHDGGYSFKGITPCGKVGKAWLEESKEEAICNAVLQTLQEGCNFLGKCVWCQEETELMPLDQSGICQDCAQHMNDLAP